VRFIGDKQDGLMIQERDNGSFPMILTTVKDPTFEDKTIWLIGWGITDQLRRIVYLINRSSDDKAWGMIGNMLPHEQFVYPRSMLYSLRLLSKEFVNAPYRQ
jgi:hypothetical protein